MNLLSDRNFLTREVLTNSVKSTFFETKIFFPLSPSKHFFYQIKLEITCKQNTQNILLSKETHTKDWQSILSNRLGCIGLRRLESVEQNKLTISINMVSTVLIASRKSKTKQKQATKKIKFIIISITYRYYY